MRIYWLPSQIPELKTMPKEMRQEIVEEALHSIPVSAWNLFSFVAVITPIVAAGLATAITWGMWIKYVYLIVALPVLWVWSLNVARPRIREIVNDIARRQRESPSVDGN
jgi:hypothetical protein